MFFKNNKYLFLLLALAGTFVFAFFLRSKDNRPLRILPVFGPKIPGKTADTIFHKISDFSFINQDSSTIRLNDVKGKIFVAEYFFTTCQSICPIMNREMMRVANAYKDSTDFRILSHTVDPETDTIAALKNYALQHNANSKQWWFLTGSKVELYEMARKSYLLNAEEGNGGEEDFIHTQNFALIDRLGRIRGFYDGTDSIEVNRLIKEIKLLYQER